MEPLAIILAVQSSRGHALSALPDAPVVRSEPPRQRRTVPIRRNVATVLHHLANLVEPRAASVRQPALH
jgi:hypothetical protein